MDNVQIAPAQGEVHALKRDVALLDSFWEEVVRTLEFPENRETLKEYYSQVRVALCDGSEEFIATTLKNIMKTINNLRSLAGVNAPIQNIQEELVSVLEQFATLLQSQVGNGVHQSTRWLY